AAQSVPVMAPPAASVAAQSVPVMAPPAAAVAAQSVPVMAPPAAPLAAQSVPVMAPPAAPVAAQSVSVMAPPAAPVAAQQPADVQVSSSPDVAQTPQPRQSIPEMTVAEVVASAELQSVQVPPMMSEEEQFEAILASMSPEERAAYEAHEAEEAERAAVREAAKMQEIREMYGNPSDISMQRKFPVGLLIALIVILSGIAFLMYKVMTAETPVDESKTQAVAVQEVVMPEQNRAAPLNKYAVKLKVSGATTLIINGVETPISGDHYFVTGHKNTIMAFGDGMVPFFKTYDAKELVAGTIQVKLEPAVLYQKGIVNFRLSKEMTGIRATFDGRRLGSFPTSIQDVVLGRPHVLVLEKDGYARHMHLIWPDTDETNVVIPDLVTEYNALSGTVCSLKPFPVSAIKYGVKITYEGTSYDAPIVPTLAHGDIIEYYITREQRRPLMFAVIPDGFGTLSVDATLLRDSIGETLVTFRRAPNSNVQPCLRRYGEVLCPQVGVETVVPSGPDWEIFGMVGDGDDVRVLRGSQIQRLLKDSRYAFDVSQDSRGTFALKITQAQKNKQPKK
ncbi:MAG: hypothetical protein IJ165_14245, partial [Proteobacteria bacterium]|nr:hypothetical protein [Pseudomonadota bacterium]